MIYIPAINRHVSIAAYCAAIRKAKANPDAEFPHSFERWWPTTGAEILREWRKVRNRRITAGIPLAR